MIDVKEKIIEHIKRLIDERSSSAEEYFQEIDDEDMGNRKLAEASALEELLKWVELL